MSRAFSYGWDFVGDAGLELIFASNADDAVRIFEGREDVAIVFTDVRMPGSMDGIKLAAAVRDRCGLRSSSWLYPVTSSPTLICRRAQCSSGSLTAPTR